MAIHKTVTEDVHKFWIGKAIKVVKPDSFGSKDVNKGDLGVVTGVQTTTPEVCLVVHIFPIKDWEGRKDWICKSTDVVVIDNVLIENIQLQPIIDGYIEFSKKRELSYRVAYDKALGVYTDIQEKLHEAEKEVRDINITMKSIPASAGRLNKDKITNMIKVVFEKYNSISYIDNYRILQAITKPIILKFVNDNSGEHGDNKEYAVPMGSYRVKIDIVRGTVSFNRETIPFAPNPVVTSMHPHINKEGKPCWGNWDSLIRINLFTNDYLGLLVVIYDFLSQCNSHGWHINGLAYTEDNAKRCHNCWLLLPDECLCGKCDICHKRLDVDCQCFRCFRSGDLVDVNMAYCVNYGCRHFHSGSVGYLRCEHQDNTNR